MHVGNQAPNPNIDLSGRNQYKDPDATYVVFVSEPTDRQSVHRWEMEVNAVMPVVPKFMYGSEQPHDWSRKDHPKVMPNPGGMPWCSTQLCTGRV